MKRARSGTWYDRNPCSILLPTVNTTHQTCRNRGNRKGRFYLLTVEQVLGLQLRQSKRVQEAGIGVEVIIVVHLSDGDVRKKLSECLQVSLSFDLGDVGCCDSVPIHAAGGWLEPSAGKPIMTGRCSSYQQLEGHDTTSRIY